MRDRPGAWLQDAVLKMGPILLGAPSALAMCMRDLGLGSSPTGYKLMRRASHRFNRGLRRVMELEGIVAKQRDSRYRSGGREWIKLKDRAHPSHVRGMLIAFSKRAGSRSR
jgi:hypothetical protein